MAVLDPLKLTITNYPDGQTEDLEAENNPEDESAGNRQIKFSKHLYIEREDFMQEPVKGWFRLAPGKEVRLKHAYYIRCNEVIKDADGQITELLCTYDSQSRGGWSEDGRKVKGTLHWVSVAHAVPIQVRLYDHLFTIPDLSDIPEGKSYLDYINPQSLKINELAVAESSLAEAASGEKYQFLRLGYFAVDPDTTKDKIVFNRISTLRDSWAKKQKNTK
jgi:glutaminyl-tRNA synthetase